MSNSQRAVTPCGFGRKGIFYPIVTHRPYLSVLEMYYHHHHHSSFYLNQAAWPININKGHTDWQTDRQLSISKRKKKAIGLQRRTIKDSKHMEMDIHIEVVSPYDCYACSRQTGRTFYNCESPTVPNEGKPNIFVTL